MANYAKIYPKEELVLIGWGHFVPWHTVSGHISSQGKLLQEHIELIIQYVDLFLPGQYVAATICPGTKFVLGRNMYWDDMSQDEMSPNHFHSIPALIFWTKTCICSVFLALICFVEKDWCLAPGYRDVLLQLSEMFSSENVHNWWINFQIFIWSY